MIINQIFPTALGRFVLEKPLNKKELGFITSLQASENVGNKSSTENYLLEFKQMTRLKKFFQESVDQYFREVYDPLHDVKLRLTQCWANFTKQGQWHHAHSHSNSFISGVFFAQTDPASDRINFMKSRHKQLSMPPKNYNPFNSDIWWFEALPNTLILFPSELTHEVPPVTADITRISISFNTFPVGTLGNKENLTELIL